MGSIVERRYHGSGLTLRIRGLMTPHPVRIHLEHESGAALIVPGCREEPGIKGPRLETVGFDGTIFTVELDEQNGTAAISASQETPILGGGTTARIQRGPDTEESALRVTGDEETMPIEVK
jgi:hypothetical protein